MSEDPIGFLGGDINLYGYVWNNPTNYVDSFGFQPGSQNHFPPGWNDNWQWGPGSRENSGNRWWDPEGGEWRWHPPDKFHPEGHWDYNPWKSWNSPWRNVPDSEPCCKNADKPGIPWWSTLPTRLPPLPVVILPPGWQCIIFPLQCHCNERETFN